MRKNKNIIINNLEIIDLADDGLSIAKHNNMVIFVKGSVPGDVVDLMLTRKRKSYAEAKLINILKLSNDRVEPFCPHHKNCGGCKWQILKYETQLIYKEKKIKDQLKRIAKIDSCNINNIIPAKETIYYRNKLEFTFSNRRWLDTNEPTMNKDDRSLEGLGFHVQGMFDRIIDINNCYLQSQTSNDIRNEIREYTKQDGYDYYNVKTHQGFMRNIIIRTSSINEIMVIIIFAYNNQYLINNLLDHIFSKYPYINSLQYVINDKLNDSIYDLEVICYKGKNYIYEKLEDLYFKVSAKSFFQTNTSQTINLYNAIIQIANIQSDNIVYDLYTGTGSIACFVSKYCKKVIGIEFIPDAINDAIENAKINNITNIDFLVGDVKDILNIEFVEQNGKPDIIILDPPRAGLHEKVIDTIKNICPQKIIYVSCNPATQARDIALLDTLYSIEYIQPVDMFPHTHHVENIISLKKI